MRTYEQISAGFTKDDRTNWFKGKGYWSQYKMLNGFSLTTTEEGMQKMWDDIKTGPKGIPLDKEKITFQLNFYLDSLEEPK